MSQVVKSLTVVSQSAPTQNMVSEQVALFDSTGEPVTPFSVESNQVAARADAAAATSTDAAGATPTKAEFDALRADYLALRTVVNDLLAKMRTANVLDS